MKQIVAYSSVAHMGGATIGLFSGYKAGITASLFSFLQHSVTSSSFFIVAGLLYDRYEAYENHFYTGLSRSMPLLAFIDIILLFSNLPFPLFGGFVGEIGFLSVLWRGNILIAIFLLVNQILCTAQTI